MMIKVKAPYQLGCLSSRWSSENLCRVGFARDRRPGCAASRESPHPGDNDLYIMVKCLCVCVLRFFLFFFLDGKTIFEMGKPFFGMEEPFLRWENHFLRWENHF